MMEGNYPCATDSKFDFSGDTSSCTCTSETDGEHRTGLDDPVHVPCWKLKSFDYDGPRRDKDNVPRSAVTLGSDNLKPVVPSTGDLELFAIGLARLGSNSKYAIL